MAHQTAVSGSQGDGWADDIDYGSEDDDDVEQGKQNLRKFDSDEGSTSLPGAAPKNEQQASGIDWKGNGSGGDTDEDPLHNQIPELSSSGGDDDGAFTPSQSPKGPLRPMQIATDVTFGLRNPYNIPISHELTIDKTNVTGNVSDDDTIAGLQYNQFKLVGKEKKHIENEKNDKKEENKASADEIDEENDALLGEGAFAKVLRARDMNNGGKYVALKSMIKRDLGKKFVMKSKADPKSGMPMVDRATVLDLVKNEIKIMLQLKHDNIVSLLSVIDDPRKDELFVVIEYSPFGQVMDWHPKHHRYVPNKIYFPKNVNKNDEKNKIKENGNNKKEKERRVSYTKECEWRGQIVADINEKEKKKNDEKENQKKENNGKNDENDEDDEEAREEPPPVTLVRFRENTAKLLFSQCVEALLYLHENRIVHRDLKPENLLLFEDNVVKLADFGTAEYFNKNEEAILVDTMGTSYYWSPGACNNENRDAYADDVWALGIVLYAFIYSVIPYFDIQEHLVFENIAKNEVIIPSNHQYAASEQVKDLLSKLLKHNEKNRIKLQDVKKHPWLKDISWTNDEFKNGVDLEPRPQENDNSPNNDKDKNDDSDNNDDSDDDKDKEKDNDNENDDNNNNKEKPTVNSDASKKDQ